MIQKDKNKFEMLKNFIKNNFCYVVTYSKSELFGVDEFKKNYDFAMHVPSTIDLPLLESMIKKLEEKLPDHLKTDDKKISIIKLGDELHGPEDKMYISRNQVLFYENMKNSSKINEAIKKYLDQKNSAQK
jgi:hypothetical protein